MVFGLFRPKRREAEHRVYCEIVALARQPVFYLDYKVPDTIDGRFDMIVLHAVLFFRRMRGEGKAPSRFAQDVFDLFFKDMDSSLRELGVTDVRVPKKIKVMGEAFYGRADAYMRPMEAGDEAGLAAAVARNVFPEQDTVGECALALARYMQASAVQMDATSVEALMTGSLGFADPSAFIPSAKQEQEREGDQAHGH